MVGGWGVFGGGGGGGGLGLHLFWLGCQLVLVSGTGRQLKTNMNSQAENEMHWELSLQCEHSRVMVFFIAVFICVVF